MEGRLSFPSPVVLRVPTLPTYGLRHLISAASDFPVPRSVRSSTHNNSGSQVRVDQLLATLKRGVFTLSRRSPPAARAGASPPRQQILVQDPERLRSRDDSSESPYLIHELRMSLIHQGSFADEILGLPSYLPLVVQCEREVHNHVDVTPPIPATSNYQSQTSADSTPLNGSEAASTSTSSCASFPASQLVAPSSRSTTLGSRDHHSRIDSLSPSVKSAHLPSSVPAPASPTRLLIPLSPAETEPSNAIPPTPTPNPALAAVSTLSPGLSRAFPCDLTPSSPSRSTRYLAPALAPPSAPLPVAPTMAAHASSSSPSSPESPRRFSTSTVLPQPHGSSAPHSLLAPCSLRSRTTSAPDSPVFRRTSAHRPRILAPAKPAPTCPLPTPPHSTSRALSRTRPPTRPLRRRPTPQWKQQQQQQHAVPARTAPAPKPRSHIRFHVRADSDTLDEDTLAMMRRWFFESEVPFAEEDGMARVPTVGIDAVVLSDHHYPRPRARPRPSSPFPFADLVASERDSAVCDCGSATLSSFGMSAGVGRIGTRV